MSFNNHPTKKPNIIAAQATDAVRQYAIQPGDINGICSMLSSDTFLSRITNFIQNMSQFVIGFSLYPFDVTAFLPPTTNEPLKIGPYPVILDSGALYGEVLPKTTDDSVKFTIRNVGSEFQKDFLSFSPFSKYFLYLPFIGDVELEPTKVFHRNIDIEYITSFLTGTARVFVSAWDQGTSGKENLEIIYQGTAKISVDLPWGVDDFRQKSVEFIARTAGTALSIGSRFLSSSTQTEYSGASHTRVETLDDSVTNPETGRMRMKERLRETVKEDIGPSTTKTTHTSNPLHSVLSGVNDILNMAPMGAGYVTKSAGGDLSCFYQCLTPYIKIARTHVHDITNYGKYFGYPYVQEDVIGNHFGFCQISNIHMEDFTGFTQDELDAVESILSNGVILPGTVYNYDLSGCNHDTSDYGALPGDPINIAIRPDPLKHISSAQIILNGTDATASAWSVDSQGVGHIHFDANDHPGDLLIKVRAV